MDRSLNYANILKQTVYAAVVDQPRIQSIKLYPVCDIESGHFLVIATGWEKERWMDDVLFHARLVGRQIVIEEDSFEEGLVESLIASGVEKQDIVTSLEAAPSAII